MYDISPAARFKWRDAFQKLTGSPSGRVRQEKLVGHVAGRDQGPDDPTVVTLLIKEAIRDGILQYDSQGRLRINGDDVELSTGGRLTVFTHK